MVVSFSVVVVDLTVVCFVVESSVVCETEADGRVVVSFLFFTEAETTMPTIIATRITASTIIIMILRLFFFSSSSSFSLSGAPF